jgi:hypothetical protein
MRPTKPSSGPRAYVEALGGHLPVVADFGDQLIITVE